MQVKTNLVMNLKDPTTITMLMMRTLRLDQWERVSESDEEEPEWGPKISALPEGNRRTIAGFLISECFLYTSKVVYLEWFYVDFDDFVLILVY